MTPNILEYGRVKLFNFPHAKAVADEVFIEDCYRLDDIPKDCCVLDIGAFYGEFAIACATRGHKVECYEPNEENFNILNANVGLNGMPACNNISRHRFAIAQKFGVRHFSNSQDHPAGSRFDDLGGQQVDCESMVQAIIGMKLLFPGRPIFVKMDCEGAEAEIFNDISWLKDVARLSMEWHNRDGHLYKEILEKHGFTVEIEGGGPKPRPSWEPGMSGGLIHAWKSK